MLAAARIAHRQLGYGYFRSIDAMTTPYVYCPHRHRVEAMVPAAATAAQVRAALRVRLTEHLIDNDEAHPQPGDNPLPAATLKPVHGSEVVVAMPTPHPAGRAAVPYTRADAIADALLFEVPLMLSRQFRFTYPVAVTAVAWFDAVAWDVRAEASKSRPTYQCEAGRITDLLWAARHAVDADRTGSRDIEFTVYRVPPTGPQTRAVRLTLVLHVHRGDHGETVATIGHPSPPHVGHFHLYEDPATVWPAVGIDRDRNGYRFPVVTADTLDEVLAHIADVFCVRGIDVTTGLDGVVHVAERDGPVVTLRPDERGRYHLRSLGRPLICHEIGS